MKSSTLARYDERSDEIPITPSSEVWRSMSRAARDAHIEAVHAALERTADLMSQGRPHSTAKMSAVSVLGDFFERVGRRIYLAAELPVLYPGEPAFEPDVIAVRDVPDPGLADLRTAWQVTEEGRGPDLALEILYLGSREKDLVTNVARYARLGIPEYFVYDRLKQRLYGYRLPTPDATQYVSIPSRSSRLWSGVLELELGIADGRLRFFYGEAVVPESRELMARLDALLDQKERQIEEESAARREAEQRADAEREARSRVEALLEEQRARAAELEARVAELLAKLAEPR